MRVGIRILAEAGGQGARGAGARQVDRHIEGIAVRGESETPITAADERDQDLADADDAGSGLIHAAILSSGAKWTRRTMTGEGRLGNSGPAVRG